METEKLSDKYKKSDSIGSGDSIGEKSDLNITPAQGNNGGINSPKNSASSFNSFRSSYVKPSSRETLFKMMVAMTGAGKSFQIIQECLAYARPNIVTGKKARPAFIVHPNVLYEPQYMDTFTNHIRIDQIPRIIKPEVYIILPINPNGSRMTDLQKRDMIITAVNSLEKVLLVLDDIDDVLKGAKPRDLDKIFVSHRHRSIDLITTHQFLNPITTEEWGAVKTISLRRKTQSVSIIEDRVPNAEILYVAEMIVDEQYFLATKMFREGRISESEWKKRKSFFVEVDIRDNLILGGYSKECFIRNCKKYLNLKNSRISDFQKIYADNDGKPRYTRLEAIERIIQNELWHYYAGRE